MILQMILSRDKSNFIYLFIIPFANNRSCFRMNNVSYLPFKSTRTNSVCYVPIIPTFELETGRATKSLYKWCLLCPHFKIWLTALQVSIFINHKCKQLHVPTAKPKYLKHNFSRIYFSYKMINHLYFLAFVNNRLKQSLVATM